MIIIRVMAKTEYRQFMKSPMVKIIIPHVNKYCYEISIINIFIPKMSNKHTYNYPPPPPTNG